MKYLSFFTLYSSFLIAFNCSAQNKINLTSPNKEITYSFSMINGGATYNVSFKGKEVIKNSSVGLVFSDGAFNNHLTLLKPVYKDSTHDYNLLIGKTSYVHDAFKQVVIPILQPAGKTRVNLLAMYVVLENALSMVCDYPAAYEGQPGFKFIQEVPTQWNETKAPNAKSGEYVVIARRHGKERYIGAITNHAARQVTIPLDFLGSSNYKAEIYSDATDTKAHPNHLVIKTITVTKSGAITISMAGGAEGLFI